MRRQSRSAYPEASDQRLALPRVPPWYRNLNRFPFRQIRLRSVLGPTYPRLTTHCRGTLAPSTERILTSLWLLLPPGSATANGPLDFTAQLPPERCARLPKRNMIPFPWVSAPGLVPYIFGAPNLGRSAVTHCLEDGCF